MKRQPKIQKKKIIKNGEQERVGPPPGSQTSFVSVYLVKKF